MQDNTALLNKNLQDNKRDSQILRSECASLEHQMSEFLSELLKQVCGDIANLEEDFRKTQQADINEMNFLKQQHQQLIQEKVNLQQAYVLMDNRVRGIEETVGFE